jgi:hypothetical protein
MVEHGETIAHHVDWSDYCFEDILVMAEDNQSQIVHPVPKIEEFSYYMHWNSRMP